MLTWSDTFTYADGDLVGNGLWRAYVYNDPDFGETTLGSCRVAAGEVQFPINTTTGARADLTPLAFDWSRPWTHTFRLKHTSATTFSNISYSLGLGHRDGTHAYLLFNFGPGDGSAHRLGQLSFFDAVNTETTVLSLPFTAGAFHDVAVTWDGATVRVGIDGTPQLTAAATTLTGVNSILSMEGSSSGMNEKLFIDEMHFEQVGGRAAVRAPKGSVAVWDVLGLLR